MKKPSKVVKLNPMCLCGCKERVALPWNRFILGHYQKLVQKERIKEKEILMRQREMLLRNSADKTLLDTIRAVIDRLAARK